MDKVIYFDNNATTRVAPEVRDVMLPFFCDLYGNPSSMHSFGGSVAKYLERSREEVARFLNADPEEVVFTSCATESDNTAIRGTAEFYGKELKVITTAVEHPAVLQPVRRLKALGYETVELPVDGLGRLNLDQLAAEIDAAKGRPVLVAVMSANNETGVIFPIAEIAKIAKGRGAVMFTDAVQIAGKTPIDVRQTDVDMLSISGHKFHAPKGIGVLYVRKGVKLKPFMLGGHQERVRRAGTENVPYIIGLAKACELARLGMPKEAEALADTRDMPERARQRRQGKPPPEHAKRVVRVHRGRGDSVQALRSRHLHFDRLRMRVGFSRSEPRHPRDGRPVHSGPRICQVLPFEIQHDGRGGLRAGEAATDHQEPARPVAVRAGQGSHDLQVTQPREKGGDAR